MSEFIPEHTPSGLDEFTTGYLEAVEWLLPEETNRDKLRGSPVTAQRASRWAMSGRSCTSTSCNLSNGKIP